MQQSNVEYATTGFEIAGGDGRVNILAAICDGRAWIIRCYRMVYMLSVLF